jgi:hypothetical protein
MPNIPTRHPMKDSKRTMDNHLLEHASSRCVAPCVACCVARCVVRYVARCVAHCVGSCACCVQHCVLALPQQQQQQPSSCPSQECTRPPWPNEAPSLMHAGKLCRIQRWTPTSCDDLLECIKCTFVTPLERSQTTTCWVQVIEVQTIHHLFLFCEVLLASYGETLTRHLPTPNEAPFV